MTTPAQLILLAEDQAHQESLYQALVHYLSIPWRRIKKDPLVLKRESNITHVLSRLPNMITAIQSRPKSTKLIVCVDGDDEGYEARKRQIENLAGKEIIDSRMVLIIPCRNIETWLEYARCNPQVDESTDYKNPHQQWESKDWNLVGEFLGSKTLPKTNPPESLKYARKALEDIRPN